MPPIHYDAIVVGSGQSGTPLAAAFAAAGRKTALVERAAVGGTCVNVGCTPTKTLVASGRVAYLAGRAADYGVRLPGGAPTVDMRRVRQRQRDMVDQFRRGSEARLARAGVDVIRGTAFFVGERLLEVRRTGAGGTEGTEGTAATKKAADADPGVVLQSPLVFLNTGARPARPALPGRAGAAAVPAARVLDSTTILDLDAVPAHLLVVGGGYVGVEFAQLFRRLGAAVTVVQRAAQLLPREDADVAAALADLLRADGLAVHLGARVADVAMASGEGGECPVAVTVAASDGSQAVVVHASHILLAAGRTPNTEDLRLDAAGVQTTPRGHIVVDGTLATTAPGVYALGDVHGGPAFTHMSYDDLRIVTANLLGTASGGGSGAVPSATAAAATTATSPSRRLVPYVVYTDPQLGHVGLHEQEARDQAPDAEAARAQVRTVRLPMTSVARALETDETRGLLKATVRADTGALLGFTCLGSEGGEVMAVVQAAMMGGLRWWDLETAVWAHPSLAEALNNLFAPLRGSQ